MAVEVFIRKWGNSLGIVLPKELVQKRHLKEKQKILIDVAQKADFTPVFGALKGKVKFSGQQFKNMVRKGWEP